MSRYAMQMNSSAAARQSGCSSMPSAASLRLFAGIAPAMSFLFFAGSALDRLSLFIPALPVLFFPGLRKA